MSGFNYLINLTVVNGGAFGKLASMAEGFESTLGRVNKAATGVETRLGKVAQRGAGYFNTMKESAGGLIGQLATIGAGVGLLKLTADMEQTNLAFEVMLKDAGKAKQLIGELNNFANVTPFSNTDVLQSGKNLAAFGFDADSIVPTLQKVGDVASGLNIPLTEMSSIFGKMKVRDIIHANDLELFTDRGIPIITELANVMGVADSAIYKMASEGKINFGHISEAFTNMTGAGGQFENMMVRQSETLGGKWSTLMGTLEMTAIAFGTKLIPALTATIDLLMPLVDWVGQNIEVLGLLASVYGSLFLAGKAYNLIMIIQEGITAGFTGSIWGLNTAMYANPIGAIIGAVIALGVAVVYAWNQFEGFRGFIMGMWEAIKEWGSMIWEFLIQPFMSFGKIMKGIFTFDADMIASGLTDAIKVADSLTFKAGERLGGAFDRGWNNGIADINAGEKSTDILALAGMPTKPLGDATFTKPDPNGNNKNQIQAKEISKGITGGGQRNITINLGKLQDQTVIYTTNIKEGGQRMADEITKALLQVLNSANQTQTN